MNKKRYVGGRIRATVRKAINPEEGEEGGGVGLFFDPEMPTAARPARRRGSSPPRYRGLGSPIPSDIPQRWAVEAQEDSEEVLVSLDEEIALEGVITEQERQTTHEEHLDNIRRTITRRAAERERELDNFVLAFDEEVPSTETL